MKWLEISVITFVIALFDVVLTYEHTNNYGQNYPDGHQEGYGVGYDNGYNQWYGDQYANDNNGYGNRNEPYDRLGNNYGQQDSRYRNEQYDRLGNNYGYQDSRYRNDPYDKFAHNYGYQDSRLQKNVVPQPLWNNYPLPYQDLQKRNELYYDNLGSRKHDRSLLENLNNFPVVPKH